MSSWRRIILPINWDTFCYRSYGEPILHFHRLYMARQRRVSRTPTRRLYYSLDEHSVINKEACKENTDIIKPTLLAAMCIWKGVMTHHSRVPVHMPTRQIHARQTAGSNLPTDVGTNQRLHLPRTTPQCQILIWVGFSVWMLPAESMNNLMVMLHTFARRQGRKERCSQKGFDSSIQQLAFMYQQSIQ